MIGMYIFWTNTTFFQDRMQILCVAAPHPSLSHVSGSVGRHLGCLALILTVGEGRARDRFVIKAASGKWLFNLSSHMRIILLETGSECNMWIFAAHFTAMNSARSHQANLILGFDALLSGLTSGLKSAADCLGHIKFIFPLSTVWLLWPQLKKMQQK